MGSALLHTSIKKCMESKFLNASLILHKSVSIDLIGRALLYHLNIKLGQFRLEVVRGLCRWFLQKQYSQDYSEKDHKIEKRHGNRNLRPDIANDHLIHK